MKKFFMVLVLVLFSLFSFSTLKFAGDILEELQKEPEREILRLKVIGFEDESPLKDAGVEMGDIILLYNGKKPDSLQHLGKLKEEVETDKVEVVLKRGEEEIKVTISKGKLGVYLKEVAPEHEIKDDAVIILDIGKLGWGMDMENSFLGCVTLLEEKYGQKLNYSDILGLSGYGFRFHFYDGWCPSSPDATCGKDLGLEILRKLGYQFEVYSLQASDTKGDADKKKSEDELRKIIMRSIDNGFPVIAIDLIKVPEWGLITGYQNDGKEFFCRTYFDMTEGYEIAQKFPWVLYVIKGKDEVNLKSEYKNSLLLAKELYNIQKCGPYFSGISGVKKWIEALEDRGTFGEFDKKGLADIMHANWWIYYSLATAKGVNAEYLINNKDKFGIDEKTIEKLAKLMKKESKILEDGMKFVPSIFTTSDPATWTPELREKQIETLDEFLKLEKEVNKILKGIK